MITVYEAKPSYPQIVEITIDEIRGQRVYYTQNGRRHFKMVKDSYSAIFLTREEAKQYCIDYANDEIASLNVKLGWAKEHLEKCNNL